VRVLLAVDSREPVPSVLNVTDGHPVLRREFYEEAARLAGLPGPAFVPRDSGDLPARRGETDKRVRSDRLLGTLGIELEHPSFRHGLRASGVTRRIGAEEAAS
jgi:nucleoside-diphosphate-sugar epimerase